MFQNISINELRDLIGRVNLIDVREGYEFSKGHVPTAVNIPLQTLVTNPTRFLNTNDVYYIICQSGARSQRACENLARQGYRVVNVLGGTASWTFR